MENPTTLEIVEGTPERVKGQTEESSPEREQEKAVCEKLNKRFNAMLEQSKSVHKSIRKGREYIGGRETGEPKDRETDEDKGLVRANLIHGDIESDVGRVYARNPEVAIRPTQAVSPRQFSIFKEFCKTAEILINHSWDECKLKRKAKACIRGAKSSRIGWLKAYFHRDLERDPEIQREIFDAQDNLANIEYQLSVLEDPEKVQEHEAARESLKNQIEALENKVEIPVWEGLAIERVQPEHILFDTDLVTDFDSWTQAPQLIHIVPMGLEEARSRFKNKFKTEDGYIHRSPCDGEGDAAQTGSNQEGKIIWILEIWDRLENVIYTIAEGGKEYLKEPYQPTSVGRQPYPFFPIAFDQIDGRFWPLSNYQLLKRLQDEHNELREMYQEDREHYVPHIIVRADVEDEDVKSIQNPNRYGISKIKGLPNEPIGNYIFEGANFKTDPNLANTDHIRQDWERVTSMGDTARGVVARSKTATEAALLNEATQQMSGSESDEIDDWLTDIARHCFEILIQELTQEQVLKIAGPKAVWIDFLRAYGYWLWLLERNGEEAVGPFNQKDIEAAAQQNGVDITQFFKKEDLFYYINVEIRAGSTGKPNRAQEVKNVIEFGPVIRETMETVMTLRESNQDELADGLIKMLQYTISKMDERIDLEDWFPDLIRDEDEAAQEDAQKKEMEIAQQQEAEEARMLEMQNLKADLEKKLAEIDKNISEAEENRANAQKLQAEATETALLPKFQPKQEFQAGQAPALTQ